MPTLKLHIGGLRDAADERRLETALASRAGVYGAVACSATGCVEVDFEDDEVAVDALLAAARDAGFEVRLAG